MNLNDGVGLNGNQEDRISDGVNINPCKHYRVTGKYHGQPEL